MDAAQGTGLLVVVGIGGLGLFFLLRLLGDVRPQDYFAISDLISGVDAPTSAWAVGYRVLVPVLIGIVVGLVFRPAPELAAAGAGAAGGVFVVWPALARPRHLEYRLQRAFSRLLLVYGMFVLAMLSLGLAGGVASHWLRAVASSDTIAPTAREVAVAVVGTAVGACGLRLFKALRDRLRDWWPS
jgi:hypothetical protein